MGFCLQYLLVITHERRFERDMGICFLLLNLKHTPPTPRLFIPKHPTLYLPCLATLPQEENPLGPLFLGGA